MGAVEIVGFVMGLIGNLAGIVQRLVTVGAEDKEKILADLRTEMDRAQLYFREGGEHDKAILESDRKLDAAIEAAKK